MDHLSRILRSWACGLTCRSWGGGGTPFSLTAAHWLFSQGTVSLLGSHRFALSFRKPCARWSLNPLLSGKEGSADDETLLSHPNPPVEPVGVRGPRSVPGEEV